jgi:CheY-like chemotaxis protein
MFARKKILIVDDEEGIREVLAASLESRDYEIHMAVDGQDGLEKARAILPDLILLDVMMPKLDGWQVMQQLQRDERTRGIPTVVLSAKSETESLFRSKEHRALDHFIKPVNLHELRSFVHRHAGR